MRFAGHDQGTGYVFNEINDLDCWSRDKKPSNEVFWPIFGLFSSTGRGFLGFFAFFVLAGPGSLFFIVPPVVEMNPVFILLCRTHGWGCSLAGGGTEGREEELRE